MSHSPRFELVCHQTWFWSLVCETDNNTHYFSKQIQKLLALNYKHWRSAKLFTLYSKPLTNNVCVTLEILISHAYIYTHTTHTHTLARRPTPALHYTDTHTPTQTHSDTHRHTTHICTHLDVWEPQVILMQGGHVDAAQQAQPHGHWPADRSPHYGPPWPITCKDTSLRSCTVYHNGCRLYHKSYQIWYIYIYITARLYISSYNKYHILYIITIVYH